MQGDTIEQRQEETMLTRSTSEGNFRQLFHQNNGKRVKFARLILINLRYTYVLPVHLCIAKSVRIMDLAASAPWFSFLQVAAQPSLALL
jgi:hypothetical protein